MGHRGNICPFVSSPAPMGLPMATAQITNDNFIGNGNMGSHRDGPQHSTEGVRPKHSIVTQNTSISSGFGPGC